MKKEESLERHVRGALFVDYVRMIRAHKGAAWARHLTASDMRWLETRIDPATWYPMESFERMGLAILTEIAHDQLALVEAFGRASVDGLLAQHPMLLAADCPRDTLMRFQSFRSGFFDFPAFETCEISDHLARIQVDFQMGARAEEAACHQSRGAFSRLLELSGAPSNGVDFSSRRWAGDATTMLVVRY